MRVIVCIKQTGYICHPIAVNRKGGDIDPEKIVYMLNPYDELAMEEAIRIKERFPGTVISALTLGPPRAEKALRYAFSLGADKMIRIEGQDLDPMATSTVLAKAIGRLEYDIILCGKKAIDSNDNMVGSFVAELLDIGQVTGVVKLDVFPEMGKAIVERSIGRGDREVIECSLPALFTVEKGLNDPRYPTLPNRLRAEKEDIERIEMAAVDMAFDFKPCLDKFTSLSPPRRKPKKVFSPDSRLSASEKRRLMMSGSRTSKTGDLIEGAPDEVARIIMKVLVQEKIV
jgi:electron transfer flavoprotein beta subunit